MPKFNKSSFNELKLYLEYILRKENVDKILNSIVNNETDILWSYVVGYKLIAHNLERLTIDDPELAYLAGEFLGNYHAVELLHRKFETKKEYSNKIDNLIANTENGIDILSDLYIAPAISYKALSSKYDKDISEELKDMCDKNIICSIEDEDKSYMLTEETRRYMKEKYFVNDIEENEERYEDSFRSKTLHLLRENNKKEDKKDE